MPVGNGPAPTTIGRPARLGSGVYVAGSGAVDNSPRRLVRDGKRLSRFMDSIYLDRPCEKLDIKKIQVLNEARRPLLERDGVGAVNRRVREALAAGVHATGAKQVLEWGCGYHPMRALLDGVEYSGLDVDPRVVSHNREIHGRSNLYVADDELGDIADASQDAIVSAFVFHFRLTRLHIATMRRVLRPGGVVLANVYRRSPTSRRELALQFRRAGFAVHRREDAEALCVDHEIWCMSVADRPDSGLPDAALQSVAARLAAGQDRSPSSTRHVDR